MTHCHCLWISLEYPVNREFDPEYLINGLLLQIAQLFKVLVEDLKLKNAIINLFTDEGLSHFLFLAIEGSDGGADGTVLFYGHMDKQSPFIGWTEGLSAYDSKLQMINYMQEEEQMIHIRFQDLQLLYEQFQIQDQSILELQCYFKLMKRVNQIIEYYLNKQKDRIGNFDLIV